MWGSQGTSSRTKQITAFNLLALLPVRRECKLAGVTLFTFAERTLHRCPSAVLTVSVFGLSSAVHSSMASAVQFLTQASNGNAANFLSLLSKRTTFHSGALQTISYPKFLLTI